MRNRTKLVGVSSVVMALAAACALHTSPAAAQTGPPQSGPAAGTLSRAIGTARRLLHGPRGEVDGVLLTDGTILNVTPDVGERLRRVAGEGSFVEARGYQGRDATGGTTLAAQSIVVNGLRLNTTAAEPPAPAGPPAPPPPGAAPPPPPAAPPGPPPPAAPPGPPAPPPP